MSAWSSRFARRFFGDFSICREASSFRQGCSSLDFEFGGFRVQDSGLGSGMLRASFRV